MPKEKKVQEDITSQANAAEQIEYVAPSTEFPFVYANNALLTLNELDGSILFGEVVGTNAENGKALVVPKVKVIMAAPFVEKLRILLARQLELQVKSGKS